MGASQAKVVLYLLPWSEPGTPPRVQIRKFVQTAGWLAGQVS